MGTVINIKEVVKFPPVYEHKSVLFTVCTSVELWSQAALQQQAMAVQIMKDIGDFY